MSDYVKKKGIRCKIPTKFSDELDKKYGYIYDDKIMEDYGLSKEFEIDRDCSLYTYNYVTQEVEIFEKMDIELSSYLIHEIFYEIYKQIKNINSYIKEKINNVEKRN